MGDGVPVAAERIPSPIVDDAKCAPHFGQTQIGIVLTQLQSVLGAAGKHAVGLGDSAGDEVVDQNAKVGLVTARAPPVFANCEPGCIDASKYSLRGSLLVAGRTVDLPGEEKPVYRFGFKRALKGPGIEKIVFDGVARTHKVRTLEPLDGTHHGNLDVKGQAGGNTVGVDFVRFQTFRLEEHLVAYAIGKASDLVFDRRAITRSHAFDHAGEHRRAIESAADDLVRLLVGVGDPARQLARMHFPRAKRRKYGRRIVARLDRK